MRHISQELRIGNLIFIDKLVSGIRMPNTTKAFAIGSIDKFGHAYIIEPTEPTISLGCNEYSAIPITKEWLLRLGWQHYQGKPDGDLTMDCTLSKIDLDWDVVGGIKIKTHYQGIDDYRQLPHITCIHQLQNLYYFLEGKELEVKY